MELFCALPGGGSLRLRDVLVAGFEGGSRTAPPGVLTSSSSMTSVCRRDAGGVSLGVSSTCCSEVLGSARTGDEGCAWGSPSSESFAIVEPPGDTSSVIIRQKLHFTALKVSSEGHRWPDRPLGAVVMGKVEGVLLMILQK